MKLKYRLRDMRTERGLSQEALAECLNVSRQTVSKWETGAVYPSAEHLAHLSEVFHVPVDAILKDDWVPPKEPEVQFVEVQVPVEVPIPVEIPASKIRRRRLAIVLVMLALAMGIAVGMSSFLNRPDESASIEELESEAIDVSSEEIVSLFPYAS